MSATTERRHIIEDEIDPNLWAIAQLLGDKVTYESIRKRIEDDAETIQILGHTVLEALDLIQYVIFNEDTIKTMDAMVLSRMIEFDSLVNSNR